MIVTGTSRRFLKFPDRRLQSATRLCSLVQFACFIECRILNRAQAELGIHMTAQPRGRLWQAGICKAILEGRSVNWIQTDLIIISHVALAMLLGAVVGFERELADKPAGMRTHMLVAGAAALFVLLGELLVVRLEDKVAGDAIRTDPIRVIEAIVTGVAFLGAGTIVRSDRRAAVQGLTTAAALLLTAAIGICVAVKEVMLAIGIAVLALLTLRTVHVFEIRLKRKSVEKP